MQREFLLNLLFLLTVNLLIKPFYIFGIDLKVQNTVGAEQYGLYFALFNFSYLFQIISDLGLQQYNNRNIAQNEHLLEKYLPSLLFTKGVLAIFVFIGGFSVAWLLGYNAQQFYLLGFLLFNQILITLLFFLRSNISGLQHYRIDSFLSILDKLIMIGLVGTLVYGSYQTHFRIEHFIYAQTASFMGTTIIAGIIVFFLLKRPLNWNIQRTRILAILRQSAPYALLVFLMAAYTRIDGVMLERIAGEKASGNYAFGYRLLDASNMICYLFAGLLLPIFSRLLKHPPFEELKQIYQFSIQLLLTISIGISLAIFIHSDSITMWLYEYDPQQASATLQILILSFNAVAIIYAAGTLLTANGALKKMNQLCASGFVFNVLLNFICIPIWGAWGAAIATLCTQTMIAIGELFLVRQLLQFQIPYSFWLKACIFFIGTFLIHVTIGKLFPEWIWQIQFIIGGLLSILWAWITQMLEIQRIFSLLRSKSA